MFSIRQTDEQKLGILIHIYVPLISFQIKILKPLFIKNKNGNLGIGQIC